MAYVVPPQDYRSGDLVFCHSKGLISRVIRVVQRLRSPKADARWNHVAVLYEQHPDDGWYVIQAEGHGVTKQRTLDEVAPGGVYEVVRCPETADPAKVVAFATSQVGAHYGFLTIASILFNLLTPEKFVVRKAHTWICSALVAGALWYAGWPPSELWTDIYSVMPSQLYGRAA